MAVKKIFDGVFKVNGKLATISLRPGLKVYGEDLVKEGDDEYRLWNPYRSKLAAALVNGMKQMHIKSGSNVLYLGAASGTTSSHVSDIIGNNGMVYCVEISERSLRDLVKVCESRQNMIPILQDARNIEEYKEDVGAVDIIYQDVAAKDQDEIVIRNASMLKKGGYAYVAVKSQSIDVTKDPKQVFKAFLESVSKHFEVVEKIDIEPYDELHLFVVLKKL